MKTLAILRAIQAADPDGRETEPTEADYLAFDKWVLDTYGEEMLRRYYKGNWEERSSYE